MGRTQVLAVVLGTAVAVESLGSVLLALYADWTWAAYVDSFTFSNGLIGVSFGLSGAVIAYYRPRNSVGWILVTGGLAQALSAVVVPVGALVDGVTEFPSGLNLSGVLGNAWTINVGLCLPLFLLLFPDGRPASPGWRWVVAVTVLTAPLFFLEMLGVPDGDGYALLWTATEVRGIVLLLLGLASIGVRFRRGSELERRQLLWLIAALTIAIPTIGVWAFVAGAPILILLVLPLLPVAVGIAIVRHNLLDIRLVVSRLATWALLSLLALGAYALAIAALDAFVTGRAGRSAVVTVVIAMGTGWLLPRLQRLLDRLFYGDRGDAARVIARLSHQLSTTTDGFESVADAIRRSLRLPYVAVRVGEELTVSGAPTSTIARPLIHAGTAVGELVVSPRAGEKRLSDRDADVLGLLTAPLAVAAGATLLSRDLQASRERLVTAREAERRRLRRDLHDGIGPTLTGIAMKADAATNRIRSDRVAHDLLEAVSADARRAIGEVRQVIENLRPESLDELGLLGALRERAEHLTGASSITLVLDLPASLPELPAAVEVAAYRVATEALNNAVRHSAGRNAVLRIAADDHVLVEVCDDGPRPGAWQPGIGLETMRERVSELGGAFRAGRDDSGGRVTAIFPLEQR